MQVADVHYCRRQRQARRAEAGRGGRAFCATGGVAIWPYVMHHTGCASYVADDRAGSVVEHLDQVGSLQIRSAVR